MVVVADTTPLRYLVVIGLIHLLPEMYGTVVVPPAVWMELRNPSAPDQVRRFMSDPPDWLLQHALNRDPREELSELDLGEREALELALQLDAELVLIDEIEGRRAARHAGLVTSGTLGILIAASINGKLDLQNALEKLAHTNFYMTPALKERVLHAAKQEGKS